MLRAVNEMNYYAQTYLDKRIGPLTFAGKDRYNGARAIKHIAEKELEHVHNSIKNLKLEEADQKEFSLSSLYEKIAYDYYRKGMDGFKTIDYKTEGKMNVIKQAKNKENQKSKGKIDQCGNVFGQYK